MNRLRWLLLGGVLFSSMGCYENPTAVTLHKVHVYKGKRDAHDFPPIWQRDRLRARLLSVQTDR